MIKVSFRTLPDRHSWQAVLAPIRKSEPLCIGFVRFTVAQSVWVARVRRKQDGEPIRVRSFADRADAAAWLLLAGGYAQEPKLLEEAA